MIVVAVGREKGDRDRLIQLVTYRWTLPILAELFRTNGSKVVTLRHRLGVRRPSLQRALSTLVDLGLIQKNPGYGHPMRPEYILTNAGRPIAAASARLIEAAQSLDLEALALQKWSLPVVHSLGNGATRFRAIKKSLPTLTSRALSLTLKELSHAELVNRSVTEGYPPVSTYGLTKAGQRLATRVTELATSMSAA